MVSWRPLPGVARSRRALTVSLVQSSCRRYQPRGGGRGPVLEGCSEEVGVADGGRCEGGVPWVRGGVGWMGCRGLAPLRRWMVGPGWARPDWAVPGGFLGVRRVSGRCGGALETCGWRRGARAGRGAG